MRVLVTGANGLLGREAIQQLQEAGHQVFGCDLRPTPGIPGREADVTLAAEVLAAVGEARPHAILHTAGLVGPVARRRHVAAAHINVVGTLNLLEAARVYGVRRFVLCSTSLVYDFAGAAAQGLPTLEEAEGPYGPSEVYGGSKLAAEALLGAYCRNFGMEGVALRFARIYGPMLGPTEGAAMQELGPILRALVERRAVTVAVPVPPRRSEYVYVKDAARACVLALTRTELPGAFQAYNVGSGELHSLQEVLELLTELLPSARELVQVEPRADARPPASMAIPLSLSLVSRQLGYQPAFPMREALRDLLAEVGVSVSP